MCIRDRALDASLTQIGGLMTQVTTTSQRVADSVTGLQSSANQVVEQARGAASACLLYTSRCV